MNAGLKKVCRSELNARNNVKATNIYTALFLSYYFNIVNWTIHELQDIGNILEYL